MAETNYTPNPKGTFSFIDFENTEAGAGSGGAGGGAGSVIDFATDPVAAPADTSVATWGVNTATGTGWLFPAGGSAWQQIV